MGIFVLGQTLWISIFLFQTEPWKYHSIWICLRFIEILSIFHLNIWWVFILQHKLFIILWLHPVTSHLCTFVRAPPSAGNTLSHLPSSLASTSPNWLPLIFSASMYVWIALTLLLWVTNLCSVLPWGPCWLPLSNVLVDIWNLSSLTGDQIHGCCVRSTKS